MLLASFDEHGYEADYANGSESFTGSGAQLTEGYYGNAVDLRGLQFIEAFDSEASSPLACYYGFGFRPHGNVDLQQGTYELWFKLGDESESGKQGGWLHNIGSALLKSAHMSQVKKPDDAWHKGTHRRTGLRLLLLPFPP